MGTDQVGPQITKALGKRFLTLLRGFPGGGKHVNPGSVCGHLPTPKKCQPLDKVNTRNEGWREEWFNGPQ